MNFSELISVNLGLLDMFTPQNEFKSVLDLGLSSARHNVCNLSPFVTKFEPLFKELLVFFEGPLTLFNGWINSS